jgi:ABC-type multidrug transport system ATPase subunit/pSer/pThr/pTyr-binding forkhead associated (FHA) protein
VGNKATASSGTPAGTLTVRSEGEQISLTPDRPFVVGRATACDLVINDGRVSRRHLTLEPSSDGWTAIDISANGTWHAGERVQRLRIHGECQLRLGAADGPEVTISPVEPAPQAGGTEGHWEQKTYLARTHELRLGRLSIGRALSNDIVVGDLMASREHAELLVGRGGTEIVDLNSANGTFVNGHRVARALLNRGDLVAIGHHIFTVGDGVLVEQVDTGDVAFEVEAISVDAGETRLLHDMTFRLPGRALLAVLGPSGAGKSTLLNALTGFRPASVGTVRFGGRDLYAEYDELRRKIGYVPQDDILHTSLTVREALEFGAKLRFPADTTDEERRARIDEVLVELALTSRPSDGAPAASGGNDLADRQVSKLSGGQRKRTSVALELLTQPTLLYLDEPTSGLDPGMDKEVMFALRRLADGGRTVVVVTHSVAQLNMCDYLLVLAKGGRIAYFGPPQQALDFFGAADWADVFTTLQTDSGAARMAQEYRSSEFYVRASSARPAVRPELDRLSRIRQQSVLSQLVTLSRRYLRVIASDKTYLRLLCIYPFVLGLIPLVIPTEYGLGVGPNGEPNVKAGTVILVLVIMGLFMGASNSIRELVKEREVYRRERAVGLSTTAYLGSKVLVLSAITAVQAIVLTSIGLLTRFPDEGALITSAAWLEMMVTVAALAVASAMLGLVFSALVDNADKTLPPLVVFVMANLVFTGGLLALGDKTGLNVLSWLFPARWGFAAAAATTDLNHVMGADTPAGREQGLVVDALWEHSAGTYLTSLAGLFVLGVVALLVTALLLRRLDPQRPSRRPAGRPPTTRVPAWLPESFESVRTGAINTVAKWLPHSGPSQPGPPPVGPPQSRPQPRPLQLPPRSGPPQPGRPQAWQVRSWQSWLAIALVTTAALLVGDRAAAAVTNDQISDRVDAELTEQKVEYDGLEVDAAGFPFLIEAATGTLDKISISITDLRAPTGGTGAAAAVTIASVDVVATGVKLNVGDLLRGQPTATATDVVGTAVITYATLDDLVKLPGLSLADIHFSESEGKLRFEARGALAPVQAVAETTVEDGLLSIKLRDARFGSRVLPELGRALLNQILAATIKLTMPALPLGLVLQSVTPGPDALSINVVGRDVPLTADV